MKISVVVLNYDGESYIEDCLDSVLASRYPNFEVVVVENGSHDGSWRLLKARYGKDERVQLVRVIDNIAFAGGCNRGAKEARGEWIVFLNADTVTDRDWLSEMMKATRGRGEKIFLQPKILIFGTKKIDCVVGRYHFPGWAEAVGRGKRDSYRGIIEGDYANGTCFMVSRKFFEEIGGFDESFKYFYEDVDLQLRAKNRGGKAIGVMTSLIEHKGSLSFKKNSSSDHVLLYYRRNRILTVIKNFSGLERGTRIFLLVLSYLVLSRKKVSWQALKMVREWNALRGEKE